MSSVFRSVLLLLFISSIHQRSIAQGNTATTLSDSKKSFVLNNNDRVVFLGNSLFENDLQYGYLETALTERWPNKNITYRNIGWTGDMVRGEARATFTNPPTAYETLLENIKRTQPTVVFIAYGGLEAMKGESGLPYFSDGLNQLIDTLDRLGARSVLISPIPIMLQDSSANTAERNALLDLYSKKIAEIASSRNKYFIDVLNPINKIWKTTNITDNGIHLNEKGYYYLASILEDALGLPKRNNPVIINVVKNDIQISGSASITEQGKNNESFSFVLNDTLLPLPAPAKSQPDAASTQTIKISGLKKGYYTLTNNNAQIMTASDKQWAEGVHISNGIVFEQAEQLRELIIQKNEVFFQQYRPMNTTYIIGFRSYEQGRHLKGLEEMSIIIKWLEGQIAQKQLSKPITYTLTKLN
ncbi:MAG: GDSL-type esterase/lipase family protein [Agriterribacter sp.]